MRHLILPEYQELSETEREAYRLEQKREALRSGRDCARKWSDKYHPGGPVCFAPYSYETGLVHEFLQLTVECYKLWHKGFDLTYKALKKNCICS